MNLVNLPAVPRTAPAVAIRRALRASRRATWSLVAIVMGLACAAPARAETLARSIHALTRQSSDETIAADLALMDAWRTRLDSLADARLDPWRMYAARAWLDAAGAEYVDNDRTGFPQAAFVRAVAMIEALREHATPTSSEHVPAAAPPTGSVRVADSLYAALERMKRGAGLRCAPEELANLEMQLAWAGNERIDQGECASTPHLAMARDLASIAQSKIDACEPPLPEMRPEPVVQRIASVDTVAVPKLVVPTAVELRIPREVHFALNQAGITPASRAVIAGIAALLEKYPSITARLEGHTDSRGDVAFNLDLSRRRVMAARAAFIALGVDSARLSVAYKGKSDLIAVEDSRRGFALNRRVEMVFVDPEGLDIQGTRQEDDLQLEIDRIARRAAQRKVIAPRTPATAKPATRPAAMPPGRP